MKNTIFLGNGLNRCESNLESWEELLTSESKKIKIEEVGEFNSGLYTMFFERIAVANIEDEYKIKKDISEKLKPVENSALYNELVNLNVENFVTTNYDYSIKKAIESNRYELRPIKNSEEIYSIRRRLSFSKDTINSVNVWHIHGEVNFPKTIMLGLDHYCGYIGKIDSYIKGRYEFQKNNTSIKIRKMSEKIQDNISYENESWIDLFFNSDVHIIGFGLEFSETDIWWLLNKRARIFKTNKANINPNKIYYYGEIVEPKKSLLKSFDVEYVEVKVANDNYKNQYMRILEIVKDKLLNKENDI